MSLTSDITLDYSKFDPNNISPETQQLSDFLEKATSSVPRWYEVGAPRFREMMAAGEIAGLKPVLLPEAEEIVIPSREVGRDIPVRVYKPDNGKPSKGVLLHSHGGGYTLGTHGGTDALLKFYANTCQLTAMSVGYRLAPEHPWPAGREDCIDVAEYLVDHAEEKYGGPLLFMAGESAGANLVVVTMLHLIRSRPNHVIKGMLLPYGTYNVALGFPSIVNFDRPVMLNYDIMKNFTDVYTPGWTAEERRNPLVSPLFEDLPALAASTPTKKLPPALFLCGTNDPVLDDTLLMSLKWMASGSEAIVKIFPGAPHVFNTSEAKVAKEAFSYEAKFLLDQLSSVE